MSDIKCPFCQQELRKRHAATTDYNSMFITYYCGNPECELTTDLIGCKEFWDILGQLIRTQKALDVAVDKLRDIDKTRSVANHKIGTQDKTLNSGIVFCWATPDEIHNTLEQITELTKGGDNE